ncbi:hypothetical protein BJF78_27985 [Pseudonocardia sp. CNS-139]|nr:hypothetical protein BJF78_27985 [Pseudonocardia sp. CNS-139]
MAAVWPWGADVAAEPDDDALLAELAEAIRPWTVPPPEVLEAAKQSFTWRTIDAELAALTYDSLLDDGPVAVRSGGQARILSFEAGPLTIEVEIDATPGARRLLGQLVPATAAELELNVADADPVRGRADELGRFVLPLPREVQRISLRCVLSDGRVVQSAWTAV